MKGGLCLLHVFLSLVFIFIFSFSGSGRGVTDFPP